jgi:hypothetical protein
MNFSAIFQPNILIFAITMCGYGIISFLVSNPLLSQAVTVPYRAVILIANLFLLLVNLGIFGQQKQHLKYDKSKFIKKPIFVITFIFLLFYSFRLVYDVLIRTDTILFMPDRSQYIVIWFFITLIPSLNFLFLDNSKTDKYLLLTWLLHLLIGVLGIFLSPENGDEFQGKSGRLAGVVLNSISLGGYGVSLAILSLYIWLREKDLLKILTNKDKSWSFIYLVGISIGVTVVILAASRGAIIQLSILIFLVVFTSGKIDGKTVMTVLFLALAVGMSTLYGLDRGSSFIDRMLLSGDEYDPTGEGTRGSVIDIAIKDISDNLLTGVGIELRQGGYPHNVIVESFLPFGLIGGVVFTFVFCYALVKSFKLLVDRNNGWSWLGLMFIQSALMSVSSGCIYSYSQFWCLLLAVIGIDYNSRQIAIPNEKYNSHNHQSTDN